MIKGLNVTVSIERVTAGLDDEIGGATTTQTVIASGVRARISSLKPTEEMRMQGIETSKFYNAVIWPATTDIREDDYIVPDNGDFTGITFKVTGVQTDSIRHNSPSAHISIRLQRIVIARKIQ